MTSCTKFFTEYQVQQNTCSLSLHMLRRDSKLTAAISDVNDCDSVHSFTALLSYTSSNDTYTSSNNNNKMYNTVMIAVVTRLSFSQQQTTANTIHRHALSLHGLLVDRKFEVHAPSCGSAIWSLHMLPVGRMALLVAAGR